VLSARSAALRRREGGEQPIFHRIDLAVAYLQQPRAPRRQADSQDSKVSNMGMQILGANGYSMEFDMQRHYRDSRASTIAAGSSQMQRNLIAGLMGLKVQP
jgi:alkylation response protein AidB-like acyl-CoA dehydrogenase